VFVFEASGHLAEVNERGTTFVLTKVPHRNIVSDGTLTDGQKRSVIVFHCEIRKCNKKDNADMTLP
jgi:hypothetical protein